MAASILQNMANRANAQLSTGPRTLEGKMQSRQNAYKHGFKALVISRVDDSEEVEASRDRWLECFPGDDEVTRTVADMAFRAKRRWETIADADDAALVIRVEKAVDTHYSELHTSVNAAWFAFCEDPSVGVDLMVDSEFGCKTLMRKLQEMFQKSQTNVWDEDDGARLLAFEGTDAEDDVTQMGELVQMFRDAVLSETLTPLTLDFPEEFSEVRREATEQLHSIRELRVRVQAELATRISAVMVPIQTKLSRITGSDNRIVSLKRQEAKFDPSNEGRLRQRYFTEAQRDFLKILGEARKISGVVPPKQAAPKVETPEPAAEVEESAESGGDAQPSPNEAKSFYGGSDDSNGKGGVEGRPSGSEPGPKRSS